MNTTNDMAGFVISAPRLDDDTPHATQPAEHIDIHHLTPVAGALLRRCAVCRTAGGIMSITPFPKLAEQLDVSTQQLRAAMRELADAGHGEATRDTLHVATWTPTRPPSDTTPRRQLAGVAAAG